MIGKSSAVAAIFGTMGKQEYMSIRSSSELFVFETKSAAEREREMLGEEWKLGRVQNSEESDVPAPPSG